MHVNFNHEFVSNAVEKLICGVQIKKNHINTFPVRNVFKKKVNAS